MSRRAKWLAIAILGFGVLSAIGAAASRMVVRTPDSMVLFDVRLTRKANVFLMEDGHQYAYWRHPVGLSEQGYYVDLFLYRMRGPRDMSERIARYPVLHDWKGDPYFSTERKVGFKDDDHQLKDLEFGFRRIQNYTDRKREGKATKPPRDLEAYKADGLLTRGSFDGGCDPLKTYGTLYSANVDGDLNRTNETRHDRSLVLLGELPMLSGGSGIARKSCRKFVDWLGSHSTRANAHAVLTFRLENDYALITDDFPLAFIVKDPRDDFCYAISYRDAYGTNRTLYALYTSPDTLTRMLKEDDYSPTDSREQLLSQAEYQQRDEARYQLLTRKVAELNCISIRK